MTTWIKFYIFHLCLKLFTPHAEIPVFTSTIYFVLPEVWSPLGPVWEVDVLPRFLLHAKIKLKSPLQKHKLWSKLQFPKNKKCDSRYL